MARMPLPKLVTFKGTTVWPKLNEPDTKWKAEGEYVVRLRGSQTDPAVIAYIEKLVGHLKAAKKAAEEAVAELPIAKQKSAKARQVNPFAKPVLDQDTGEETGEVDFTFKMPAKVTSKKTGKVFVMRPDIYDAKGKKLDNAPEIWGGTTGKVSHEISPYYVPATGAVGISLRLRAFQIIDLVSKGGSAASEGFGEEDGYEGEEETASPVAVSSGSDVTSDDDGSGDF